MVDQQSREPYRRSTNDTGTIMTVVILVAFVIIGIVIANSYAPETVRVPSSTTTTTERPLGTPSNTPPAPTTNP